MPPSMLSREALVIWMFRIAMNEPIMAAITAIQTVTLARFGSTARVDWLRGVSGTDIADRAGFDIALSPERRIRYFGYGYRSVVAGMRPNLRLRLDGRDHRHTWTQLDRRAVVAVERDLHRNALDD